MAKVQVLFMPTPGVGHLISTVEFAKYLLKGGENRFSATIFTVRHPVPTWASATASYIDSVISLGLDIAFEELSPADPLHGKNGGIETFTALFIDSYKPQFKDAVSRHLSDSTNTVAAVVLDLFCTTLIDVVHELGLPSYIFFTSSAATLSLLLYAPTYFLREVEGDIDVPNLLPIPRLCLPPFLKDKNSENCVKFLGNCRRFLETSGIIVNTFVELEQASLEALADGKCVPDHPMPPIFPVGPLLAVELKKDGVEKHELIEWLDEQPPASVLFLCFGSMGCFGGPQVKAMAKGLERSDHRFLWVLRSPSTENPLLPTDSNLDEVLPEGFLERTHRRGMVWPSWAPQVEILAHTSVGGFVTHCGWNSCSEGLWFGVPMLAWPLYAEQHFNAFEMGRELGVALELELDHERGDFVSAEELERGVRELMGGSEEGEIVRRRVKEMKVLARKALKEGGSSAKTMECFMQKLIKEIAHANHRVT